MPVDDDDGSCTPGFGGWEGFKPRAVVEVKSVGKLLKEKLYGETSHHPYRVVAEAFESETLHNKETGIMSNAIIRLADSQLNKQIEDFGGLSLDIKDALADLQAQERKESAQAAAKEIVEVLKLANSQIEYQVGFIREARRQEEAAKKKIEAVNRAKAYGLETNNFVPLGVVVGTVYPHQVHNKDLIEVPKDWAPKPKLDLQASIASGLAADRQGLELEGKL
jgi:hypothetical protein